MRANPRSQFIASLGMAAAIAGCATSAVPTAFPRLDPDLSTDSLVVMESFRGDYLPQFPECDGTDVICMDPPPFWFRARVRTVLFGDIPTRKPLVVTTTSHYGIEGTLTENELILARFTSDGTSFVMPRYAQAILSTRRDGELFLVLWNSRPIWWLPCNAVELAEPIAQSDFVESLAQDSQYFPEDELEAERLFLQKTPDGVVPRQGVSITKLSASFRQRTDSKTLPYCKSES